ncbi:hypothetical protein KO481_32705 [Nocardia sp. NEAU-G5]|uniref:Uncharacterized protein n=1 Tax=Nocardia albiluteola TaxID=2842303 RepID=A0ABS6BA19_9NOCA|nr:hypothetical protein [Nocardia albiluteola]MBU3066266.1 hypothetical protein [Nocardia albiluteola]
MKSMESRMRGNSHVRFGGRPQETESRQLDHRACGRPNHPPAHLVDPLAYALGIAADLAIDTLIIYDLAHVDDNPARACTAVDLETVCPPTTWARAATTPTAQWAPSTPSHDQLGEPTENHLHPIRPR